MTILDYVRQYLLIGSLCVLGITLLACFVRTLLGPRIADRIVGVNMISTQVIIAICILAVYLGEGGLVDVALIYAMLGFLAVVVLCKIYIGVYADRRRKRERAKNRSGHAPESDQTAKTEGQEGVQNA